MKVIDIATLQTALDSDLVWRRREISSLVSLASSSPAHTQNSLVRAAIPLLYAHWEGFGRECLLRYLEFVSYKRIKFKQLDPSFLYLASLSSLSAFNNCSVKQAIETINGLFARIELTNKNNFRKKINTKSNLRSEVLRDLLLSCGLDVTWLDDYDNFINQELCDPRNEIAHGGGSAPSLKIFVERRNEAFNLMTTIQTLVVNSASNETYLLSTDNNATL